MTTGRAEETQLTWSTMGERLDLATIAYVAGVIDLQGLIRTRYSDAGELPYLALSGPNTDMLTFLGDLTGTTPFVTTREYSKAGCSQHCKEKHQHVVSRSGRWSLTGVKATVVLWNIRPYLRIQADAAREALVMGLHARYKPASLVKMAELGWYVPEFGGKPT